MTDALLVIGLLALFSLVVLGLRAAQARRLRDLQSTYEDVLSDNGLVMTDRPCGLTDDELAAFELLPVGDRRSSAVWGAEGRELVRVAARDLGATCAAFEWWWEDFVSTSSRPGHERSSRMVALVTFDDPVALGPDAVTRAAARRPGAEVELRGRTLALALPATPRGIVRMRAANDDLASTSAEPIEDLADLRADALAVAAQVVVPA